MARDGQGERHKLMTATQKVRTLHFRKKEVKLKESRCGRAAGSQSRPAVMLRARESPQPQKSQQSAPHAQLLRYTRWVPLSEFHTWNYHFRGYAFQHRSQAFNLAWANLIIADRVTL